MYKTDTKKEANRLRMTTFAIDGKSSDMYLGSKGEKSKITNIILSIVYGIL